MAASPRYKVYRGEEYVAACKHVEDAAAIVALSPTGAKIKVDHSRVVWDENNEAQSAGDSFDFVAQTVYQREHDHNTKLYDSVHGPGAADTVRRRIMAEAVSA